jgi:hypothetical protein
MDASLDTLVVAAYVFADGLVIPRTGPVGKITDAELIALSVAQAVIGVPSDRQFLGLVGKLLPGWFPHLPDPTAPPRVCDRLDPGRHPLTWERRPWLVATSKLTRVLRYAESFFRTVSE